MGMEKDDTAVGWPSSSSSQLAILLLLLRFIVLYSLPKKYVEIFPKKYVETSLRWAINNYKKYIIGQAQ